MYWKDERLYKLCLLYTMSYESNEILVDMGMDELDTDQDLKDPAWELLEYCTKQYEKYKKFI